jgi:hypothetical protein
MVGSCWRLREGHWEVIHIELVGVFADVIQKLLPLLVLLSPVSHVISSSTVLKSLQDLLVLHSNFHQLSLPSISVQTFTPSHHTGVSLLRASVELARSPVFSFHRNMSDILRLGTSSSFLLLKDTGHLL